MKTVFVFESTLHPAAHAIFDGHVRLLYASPTQASSPPAGNGDDAVTEAFERAIERIHATYGSARITSSMIERATRLEVIILPSSGADAVDVDAATARGIPVINAAGAAYTPVAEHVLGLALSLVRGIAWPDREVHACRHQRPDMEWLARGLTPSVLRGKTLGIVGFGFIGRALAQKARGGFDMDVIAYDPSYDAVEADLQGVRLETTLESLLTQSDIVSLNCPLTPTTNRLIGERELASMKPSAHLINCARGAIVNTDALVRALGERRIAGAGLDVTDPEPLPDHHPLCDLENVILTPHLAGFAEEFLPITARQTASDGLAVLRGEHVHHVVDHMVWPAFAERARGADSARRP